MLLMHKEQFGKRVRSLIAILLSVGLAGCLMTGCGGQKENGAVASETASAGTQGEANEPDGAAGKSKETVPAADEMRTVEDELGHELTIPAQPKRIFAPYLEDSLVTLGVKPVAQWANGGSVQPYLQDRLADVPKLDFSAGLPSPEELMTYEPDLIILHAARYADEAAYAGYSKIAPTYVFNNASGDTVKSLQTIGDLVGRTAEAEQAIRAYNRKAGEAKEKLAQAAGGKKAAIIRFAAKGVSLMGANYLAGYVVHKELGLGIPEPVGDENSVNVSMEELPELDADYIFIVNQDGQGAERLKEMTDSRIWKLIPAVKAGRVYEVNEQYWLGSGLVAYGKIIDDTVKLITQGGQQ